MKSALRKGQLKAWKDDQGFGFIKPERGGKDVFLHISALKGASRRPEVGDIIWYRQVVQADGKIRASGASIQGVVSNPVIAKRVPKRTSTNKRASWRRYKKRLFAPVMISLGIVLVITSLADRFRFARVPFSEVPVSEVPTSNVNCVVKGNISINTGRKLYHLPGMEDYESTNIILEDGERWFCSEQDAIANGWQKAPK